MAYISYGGTMIGTALRTGINVPPKYQNPGWLEGAGGETPYLEDGYLCEYPKQALRPFPAEANSICLLQTGAANTPLVLSTAAATTASTYVYSPATGNVYTTRKLDCNRNVAVTVSLTVGGTVTIHGFDNYLNKLTETITIPSTGTLGTAGTNTTGVTVETKCAFALVYQVIPSAVMSGIWVGVGKKIGLYFRCSASYQLPTIFYDDAPILSRQQNLLTYAAATGVQTATSGDVRGTINLPYVNQNALLAIYTPIFGLKPPASNQSIAGIYGSKPYSNF